MGPGPMEAGGAKNGKLPGAEPKANILGRGHGTDIFETDPQCQGTPSVTELTQIETKRLGGELAKPIILERKKKTPMKDWPLPSD